MAYFKSGDRQRGRKLIDEAASRDPQFKQSKLFQEAAQLQ
jgi:hypothetical protein